MRLLTGFLLIVCLWLTGCGFDSEKGILMAAGSYGDLAVVLSDESLRPLAGRFLSEMNLEKTFVIKPETLFKPDFYGPGKWELSKGYKNALFLVRIGDGGDAEKAAEHEQAMEATVGLPAVFFLWFPWLPGCLLRATPLVGHGFS